MRCQYKCVKIHVCMCFVYVHIPVDVEAIGCPCFPQSLFIVFTVELAWSWSSWIQVVLTSTFALQSAGNYG